MQNENKTCDITFKKVYCLFEQSGTFKQAFLKIGYPAFDYDIENKFKETDVVIDLFAEIEKFGNSQPNILSMFSMETLIFAFFPCTYFTDQSMLSSRGDANGMGGFSTERKLLYSAKQMKKRADFYEKLCLLCYAAYKFNFPLIIENPNGLCGFLRQYFPIKNKVVITDRRVFGDKFKKSTQFFFINCSPSFNLVQECVKSKESNPVEDSYGFARSVISNTFAELFIKNYIL